MDALAEGRPHLFLQKLFLVLNRHNHAFSFGDIAFADPDAVLCNKIKGDSALAVGKDAYEVELTQPVTLTCMCAQCIKSPIPITHLHLKHTKGYTLMRLRPFGDYSFLGTMEMAKVALGWPCIRVHGCTPRYAHEDYTSMREDARFMEEVKADAAAHEFYSRKIRTGNEMFLNFTF